MQPIMQTNTDVPGGDCFRACVASILELPIHHVPHFCGGEDGDHWFQKLAAWAHSHHLAAVYSAIEPLSAPIPGYCILGVRTRRAEEKGYREEWIHAVVGYARVEGNGMVCYDIVHDPHPNPSEVLRVLNVVYLVRNIR